MKGAWTFLLDSHLPDELKAGRWPRGRETIPESSAETYVPLFPVPPDAPSEHFGKSAHEVQGVGSQPTVRNGRRHNTRESQTLENQAEPSKQLLFCANGCCVCSKGGVSDREETASTEPMVLVPSAS